MQPSEVKRWDRERNLDVRCGLQATYPAQKTKIPMSVIPDRLNRIFSRFVSIDNDLIGFVHHETLNKVYRITKACISGCRKNLPPNIR